jgi:predicted dehydrogenase
MNQAPHTMDLLCHLVGPPATVWGWTRTLYHAMECEDTAQAMLEYPNGAPGYFATSTTEAGGQGRLQIVGDRAALEISGNQLTISRFTPSSSEHRIAATDMFSAPQVETEVLTLSGDGGGHLAVHRDLQAAIAMGTRPRSDGREGLLSLEMANAIILSSYTQQPVTLPVDRAAYTALLSVLRAAAEAAVHDHV